MEHKGPEVDDVVVAVEHHQTAVSPGREVGVVRSHDASVERHLRRLVGLHAHLQLLPLLQVDVVDRVRELQVLDDRSVQDVARLDSSGGRPVRPLIRNSTCGNSYVTRTFHVSFHETETRTFIRRTDLTQLMHA